MIKPILKRPYYFGVLLVFLLTASVFNICFSKADGFLILNQFHRHWLDEIFKVITNFGDGIFVLLVVAATLVFGKKKKSLCILLAYVYSGLAAQILKRLFHMPRPKVFLELSAIKYTSFVEGVSLAGSNSFPSGHSASVFALGTALVLVYKKKNISFLMAIFAIMVGYSRIYLAQHFLQDVMFGALLGILSALFSYHQVYHQKFWRVIRYGYKKKGAESTPQQAL